MPDIFISEKIKKKEKKSSKKRSPRLSIRGLEEHTHNTLSSFCYYPDNVEFETKDRKERVILLLRRHPITNFRWIIIGIFMALAPLLLGTFPILSFLPESFRLISVLGWYLITIAFVLEGFLTWFFNVNIVTDERIIDIDFQNLIYKELSDAKIDNIQDKTIKMGGVIRTIFNYGDVHIQTAAESREFDFLAVPRPDKVLRILDDLILQEEQEKIEGRVR